MQHSALERGKILHPGLLLCFYKVMAVWLHAGITLRVKYSQLREVSAGDCDKSSFSEVMTELLYLVNMR